jgi:hypothetical protein
VKEIAVSNLNGLWPLSRFQSTADHNKGCSAGRKTPQVIGQRQPQPMRQMP